MSTTRRGSTERNLIDPAVGFDVGGLPFSDWVCYELLVVFLKAPGRESVQVVKAEGVKM